MVDKQNVLSFPTRRGGGDLLLKYGFRIKCGMTNLFVPSTGGVDYPSISG